jgi:hypothetical protein
VDESQSTAGSGGPAILDIGDHVGALVLYAPEAFLGHEVELAPEIEPTRRVHTVVREWRIGSRRRFPAVFPSLDTGRYRICAHGPAAFVTIDGGAVTEADWPD